MTQQDYIQKINIPSLGITDIKAITNTKYHYVFQVTQQNQNFIYKSSNSSRSFQNFMLSRILRAHNIPVPDTKIFINNGYYFERYPKLPGQTPFEKASQKGLSIQDAKNIIQQMLIYDKKISEINIPDEKFKEQIFLFNRKKPFHIQYYGKFLAQLHYVINKKITTCGNVRLHQCDWNRKNVLLDNYNNITTLLDLESIAFCNEYAMLYNLLFSWPEISITEVTQMYNSIFEQNINVKKLKHFIRFQKTKNKIVKHISNIKKKIK